MIISASFRHRFSHRNVSSLKRQDSVSFRTRRRFHKSNHSPATGFSQSVPSRTALLTRSWILLAIDISAIDSGIPQGRVLFMIDLSVAGVSQRTMCGGLNAGRFAGSVPGAQKPAIFPQISLLALLEGVAITTFSPRIEKPMAILASVMVLPVPGGP